MREWFPNGEAVTFMQDGVTFMQCHTAKSVTAFLASENIPLLKWPGNSPDMNPIKKSLGTCETQSKLRDHFYKAGAD